MCSLLFRQSECLLSSCCDLLCSFWEYFSVHLACNLFPIPHTMSIKKHIFFVLFWFLFPLNIFCYAQSSSLELTEVYFDGTDERVEITNISSVPFVGEVSLSGAKSSLVSASLSLDPWESIVIGDDGKMLLSGYVFIGNNWLQLADTSQIRLWLHGPWVDSFFEVDSWLVSELNNTQTSLCKSPLQVVGACGEHDTHGVVSWVIANPWIVGEWWLIAASGDIGSIVESGVLLWSWEDTILTWDGMFTWDGIDGDIFLDTWYLEWASLCVPVETGVIQPIYYPSPLLISEIYPFSKYSGSYIEVYARGSYSWVVLFTWAGAWEKSLRVHVDVDTWVYIVFAAGERWDYILTWLSLRDDGETIGLVDDSAHVMDRVVYYSGSSIKSHYFSSYSWDLRVFSAKWDISPQYEMSIISSNDTTNGWYGGCWIDLERSSTYAHSSSLNFKAVLLDQWWNEMNVSSYRCLREYGDGRQEQWSCNPWWFTYSWEGLYTISLTVLNDNSRVCQTKQFINYVDTTPAKTVSWSSSSTVLCPVITTPKTTQILVQQAISNATWMISWSIIGALPNPAWKDGDNERIFVRISGDVIRAELLGLRLKTSKKHYPLKWWISLGSWMYVFDGWFGLHNGSWCLELFQESRLLDTWCYSSVKEWTVIWRDWVNINASSSYTWDAIAASFASSSVRGGLAVPKISAPSIKITWSKTAKSTVSWTSSKQVTKKTSTSSDAKDKKIQQLSKEITSTERIVQLQKNYIHLLSSEMGAVSHVFTWNKLQLFDKAYRSLMSFAKQQPSVQVQNTTIPVTDIRTYLSLVHNILPIQSDLSIPYSKVRADTLRQYWYMWGVLYRG